MASLTKRTQLFLDHAHPKFIKVLFSFPELALACKNWIITSIHSGEG